MSNQPERSKGLGLGARSVGALALALCLVARVHAQQDQQQGQEQEQAQPQPPPQPQNSPARPSYAPQDADKPPYSRDRPHHNSPDGQHQQALAYQPAQPAQPLPGTLTIPAGTILLISTNDFLSSDRNQIGDHFTASLDQPIVVNGWVVARRGQALIGQVKEVKKAGRVKGVSQLGVELTDLTLADGRQMPILTQLWRGSAGTSHGQDAATIAGTSGFGAMLGSIADWGTGAAIGAGAGAAVGIAAVLLTRGHPTELPPETPLTFRLMDPVTVDTTKSQQAFLPVTQQDIDAGRRGRRGPRLGYPGPGYGPCGPYGPCYGYPWSPAYVGVYGAYYGGYYRGYGWGPRYHGYYRGPR